jgi:membrane protein implicated in regulation of membrane protease activity
MQWWAWIAVGAILLGSELTFIDAQFYLVFVGGSAIVVGLLGLAGLALAPWLQWLIFAALAAVSMLTFRRQIYERMRRNLPAMKGGPAGETVTLPQALPPGETCRLEFRGSSWSAQRRQSGDCRRRQGAHRTRRRTDPRRARQDLSVNRRP